MSYYKIEKEIYIMKKYLIIAVVVLIVMFVVNRVPQLKAIVG